MNKKSPKQTATRKMQVSARLDTVLHNDGWKNIISGIGMEGIDKSVSTEVGVAKYLTEQDLVELYKGDGISSRAVNIVADDMIRNGWEIPNDKDGKLYTAQQKLGLLPLLGKALRWARLFGGSLAVMMFEGGGSLASPLEPYKGARSAKLRSVKVYQRNRILLNQEDIGRDPSSPYFEEYEYFTVMKKGGETYRVHASRCLVFRGIPNPDTSFNVNQDDEFWGMSCLQPAWDAISSLGATLGVIPTLTAEFSIGVFTLSNLEQILAENDTKAIYDRMTIMAACKSSLNAVILGKEETFTRNTLNFSGLPEIMDRLFMMVSGVFGIPVTRLFGRSAAGQNATGEGDSTNYFDMVAALQILDLQAPLTRVVHFINSGLGSPVAEDDISIEFLPVWQPSQLQLVEMKARQSSADQIYLETGVLSADEVRVMRFSGSYSFNSSLEDMSKTGSKAPGIPAQIGAPTSRRNTPVAAPAPLPDKARKK